VALKKLQPCRKARTVKESSNLPHEKKFRPPLSQPMLPWITVAWNNREKVHFLIVQNQKRKTSR